MDERQKSHLKFVNLHSHCVGSIYDGLGFPADHMEAAYANGLDAQAITDHGNMNMFPYQLSHAKQMKKDGKNFKPIFGVEAYFIPSLSEWQEKYEYAKGREKSDENDTLKKELSRRYHLLLLAQNYEGLKNIFKLISVSNTPEYFYRYPRIDYDLLRKYNKGIIVSSSCIGGLTAKAYWKNKDQQEAHDLKNVYEDILEEFSKMITIFGKRFVGELQYHNLDHQHIINDLIIRASKELGFKLISTADSHYATPSLWKSREVYKQLGWLGKKEEKPVYASDKLPSTVEEMGFELFIKNGDQMFDAYKKTSKLFNISFDDDIIRESIEYTHHLAFNVIENIEVDTSVKLPSFVVPEGETDEYALTKLCIQGLKELRLNKNEKYVNRLKYELDVIKERKFCKYFLTMKIVSDEAKKQQLVGPARGSAAGALISYVLGITQVDPLRHGLHFERFMLKDSTSMPDIDYDVSDPMRLKEYLIEKWGTDVVVPISNWNTLQLKSLIKDISKLYEIPFKEVNAVTSVMMDEAMPKAKKKNKITSGVYTPTYEEVMEYSESLQRFLEQYPQVGEHVKVLQGQIKSCFTNDVEILTRDGYKEPLELADDDEIAYIDHVGELCFNKDWDFIYQGKKDYYLITLEDGSLLELTGDHEVQTQFGYKKVDQLGQDDILFQWS